MKSLCNIHSKSIPSLGGRRVRAIWSDRWQQAKQAGPSSMSSLNDLDVQMAPVNRVSEPGRLIARSLVRPSRSGDQTQSDRSPAHIGDQLLPIHPARLRAPQVHPAAAGAIDFPSGGDPSHGCASHPSCLLGQVLQCAPDA